MNTPDVALTTEEQRTISKIYDKYQEENRAAHDLAREQIAIENDIEEEEAEAHPEMEGRFNEIRGQVSQDQNGVTSIDPNTGEPGQRIAKPRPKKAKRVPQQRVQRELAPEYVFEVNEIETLLSNSGYVILQSATDYTQGIITLVVSTQE
jgi:hypothetical protein